MNCESRPSRRKSLRYRAWRRGTKEMDFILGGFADARLDALNDGELDQFEALLEAPDPDLYAWICGRAETPEGCRNAVAAAVKALALAQAAPETGARGE